MKLSPSQSLGLLIAVGLVQQLELIQLALARTAQQVQSKLIERCCQVGKERAVESSKFNCKSSAREALVASAGNRGSSLALMAETFLANEPNFADQCEMVLESCCMSHHRTRNCDSGKQFAKSGAACMDVELSKEATIATESFNDCCMSCSLGILAARNPAQNETSSSAAAPRQQNNLSARCKLISPLASSLSGQLYEQTYIECCQENLPKPSGALVETGAPIDCSLSNPCSHRCLPASDSRLRGANDQDRCECFAGYKLASDGVNCVDIDECKLGTHTCDKDSAICDNIKGSYRCLARSHGSSHRSSHHPSSSHHHHQLHGAPVARSLFNSATDSSSSAADDQSPAEFISLRLCPVGSRWSHAEGRCSPLLGLSRGGGGGGGASLLSPTVSRFQF